LMCSADLKWFELAFLVSELSNGWKRGEKNAWNIFAQFHWL
jgi:hypothetical protein